jgi:hypothetical protein
VALYFENSIASQDLAMLAAAASAIEKVEVSADKLIVHSRAGAGIRWDSGPALVDGKLWPAANDEVVWVPSGVHSIQRGEKAPSTRLLDFNGDLISASASSDSIEFAYRSNSRALAILEHPPQHLEIDGTERSPVLTGNVLILPRGQHLVSVR